MSDFHSQGSSSLGEADKRMRKIQTDGSNEIGGLRVEPILKAGAKVEIQGDRAGSWQNPGGPEGLLREENGEGCPRQRLHCEQRH